MRPSSISFEWGSNDLTATKSSRLANLICASSTQTFHFLLCPFTKIAEFVSVLSCALFTGASVYINLVEHPARMQCGVELGLLSSLAAWLAGATVLWLFAGVLLGLVIPFTLIVILPTNKRLLSPALDRGSAEAERLLTRWGRMHAVRSVLSGVSLLLFLYLLIFSKSL